MCTDLNNMQTMLCYSMNNEMKIMEILREKNEAFKKIKKDTF